ncbi:MAG: integral rane sensor signal transduction histidine kinase [Candidatus Solibacter sp.]|jgi:signal transduction histidine kinase|nr:integral rane sensor signal transduction histidine kinase [Candidatus Solibacter sp.]
MLPRQITHQNIFRVLIAGFSLVTLLLVAAAIVSIRNIQSVRQNVDNLVREQSLSNHLIDELHSQQTTLSEVFSVLARDPDSVDYYKIMSQLDEADRDTARISADGARTPEHDLWTGLNRSSLDFSREARRLLAAESPETFSSIDLFRYHGAFASVVARLLEAEYRKLNDAQGQIERRTSSLSSVSLIFAATSVVLALIFAIVTVRLVTQLIREMESQTAELGRVSWHMLEDQEATARRFSHELHDELGQSLTAVKTNLTALASASPAESPRFADCLHLVDEAIGNVRQMSQLLRPTILDDFGLEAGLRWLAEGFSTRTGIDVRVHSTYAGRLPDDHETHLFRIAQEALTNIARHAEAKHVTITLDSQSSEICLAIHDDGHGIIASPRNGRGLGMIGMRARARSAGGDVNVRSRPGDGVLIEVRIPLRHEKNPHPAV